MDWKVVILERLRVRNSIESGGFTELIASHGKLQDQVETLRREITRLEYQKNELERERDEDGAGLTGSVSGDASKEVARYRKKVEELQNKLTTTIEDLMAKQNQWMEATTALRKKDDELKSKDNVMKQVENGKKALEEKVAALKLKLLEQESANLTLKDELLAHQIASSANEEKLKTLTKEYDMMRNQLIQIRSKQADELNEANEMVRKERDKRLEEDIKRASEEKDPFLDSRSSSSVESSLTSSRKRTSESSSGRRASGRSRDGDKKTRAGSAGEAAAEVVGPSICPASPFHTFDAHDSEVSAMCFSSDGNYLATGSGDKLVKVWSWRESQGKMELKFTLRGCTQSIMSVQFDQNNRQVLAGSNDGSARIWTLHDERSKHTLTGHANRVMAAKFLEDNMKVVTGSHDRTLKIWDLQHKACTKTLFAGSSCNDVVAGRGMGTTVISGHFDRRIRFWDTRTATANEIALQGKVTSLDHYPDKHWLLCCSRDDALRLIDLRQNSIMTTFNANGFRVGVDWTRACFSPDGQYVAAGSSDGSLFIWDTYNSSKKREKCKEHNKDVVVCSWNPTGQLFVTGDRSKKVILWKR